MRFLSSLLFFFCSCAAFAQAPLTVKCLTLSNGMSVWVNVDKTQPKVFGAVVVRAGAKDCPNTGIAHYLEHLLFKGSQKIGTIDYAAEKPWLDSISSQYDLLAKTRDESQRLAIQRHINDLSLKAADYAIPNEFNNLISLYGGTGLNAATSFDETVFHNTFSPQYLRQWCELNSERLRDPVFRLFQGELETVYEEKNMYADNLLTQTAEKVQQYALAGTPYAYPIVGATDSLKNPRLSEMMRFFKEYYVPENMGLMLVGDIPETDSLLNVLEKTFGQLRSTSGTELGIRTKSKLRDFRPLPALELKVPIPIVKIGGFVWQAPDERSKDYAAFKVMTSMLTNDDRTGLMDSLTNNGKILFNAGLGNDFKDFSAWGFGFVPKILGSREKAEKQCFEQINKIKSGQFSNASLEAEKLALRRNQDLALETIDGRRMAMINAFSHGLSWSEVMDRSNQIAAVTREDIMRVANTYINDDSLKIVKKYGSYPKEHLSQPGYKPVKPKNAGRQSAYAMALAKEPIADIPPRLIDVEKDAHRIVLSPLVNLYTVNNPENDIFTLQIIYHRGTRNDSRLDVMADYLDEIGTEQHSRHQFGQLLRQQGATLSEEASANNVTITLTGFDNHFNEAVALLHEFLTQPKADKDKFSDLVDGAQLEKSTFFNENKNIAQAVVEKVAMGDNSDYLRQVSPKELKKMGGDELVNLFKQLQLWQTDIVYCGRLDANDVENSIKNCIDVSKVSRAWEPVKQPLQPVDGKTVYIYDNPSARQTIVGTYSQIAPMPSLGDRALLRLWGTYFGGGMESVMFQEVREFHSLAYYSSGYTIVPELKVMPDSPCGFVTLSGTQSDKAMQAVELIDSLFDNMPLRENSLVAANHSIINAVNNGYPSFRAIGNNIAALRLRGYDHDANRDLLESLKQLDINSVSSFYSKNVQHHPRAIIIVGDKKKLDMSKLAKIGQIVELKKDDIYK